MRNIILGAVGIVWGAAILIAGLAGVTQSHGASYGAGQMAGYVFGVVFLLAGLVAVRNGLRQRRGGV
jgi:hypothetical protein